MKKPEAGWTLLSLLAVVLAVVVLALLFMKLLPPYFDNSKIGEALNTVAKDPQTIHMTRGQIIKRLDKILYIDYADEAVDLEKAVRVQKSERNMHITINYEVVVGLVYNLSALLEFRNAADVPIRG